MDKAITAHLDFGALELKDDILVLVIGQHVLGPITVGIAIGVLLLPLQLGVFLRSRLLLDTLDLFQPEELLAIHFVQLGVDVRDGVLGLRDNDMFAGIGISDARLSKQRYR